MWSEFIAGIILIVVIAIIAIRRSNKCTYKWDKYNGIDEELID